MVSNEAVRKVRRLVDPKEYWWVVKLEWMKVNNLGKSKAVMLAGNWVTTLVARRDYLMVYRTVAYLEVNLAEL